MKTLVFDMPSGPRAIQTDCGEVVAFCMSFLSRFDIRMTEPVEDPSLSCLVTRSHKVRLEVASIKLQEDCTREDVLPAFDLMLREAMRSWTSGFLVLHAAVLASSSGAVLVAGGSGAGKSTLAAAWFGAGHQVLSDEFCWFEDRADPLPLVLPFPRPWEITHDRQDPLLRQTMNSLDWCGYPFYEPDGSLRRAAYMVPPAPLPPAQVLGGIVFPVTKDLNGVFVARISDPSILLDSWLHGLDPQSHARCKKWLLRVPAVVIQRAKPSSMVHELENIFEGPL